MVIKPLKRRIWPNSRSLKKFTPTCGIYEILHRPTGRRYVGSSAEVEKRLYWHFAMLRKGTHHCTFLQNVWNKYGPDGFETFLLEQCYVDKLIEREQYHMDSSSPYSLMNLEGTARATRGWKHSEEVKLKISETAKRVGADPTERQRRSERAKLQHRQGNIGREKGTPRPRICLVCIEPFVPNRLNGGQISQSAYCIECRPEHKGGNYKYERALHGEGKPKQLYRSEGRV